MIVSIYGYIADMDKKTKIRKNFTLEELANNLGDPKEPQFLIDADSDVFLDMLQEMRDWFNKPMKINSCYRQKGFNSRIPSADKRSAHLRACASDWGISGHTEAQRMNVYKEWEALCRKHKVIGAINYYTNGYHLEAFSDKCYGSKAFAVRDYRGKKEDW